MKSKKYHYHVLITKDALDNGIHLLAYFHKNCKKQDVLKNFTGDHK